MTGRHTDDRDIHLRRGTVNLWWEMFRRSKAEFLQQAQYGQRLSADGECQPVQARRRPWTEGHMAETRKCAHPSCQCMVPAGGPREVCSEHCQEAREIIELRCDCKHPGCG